MVSNSVQVNEEVDPVMVVRRLKAEIVELKEEIALLRGGNGESVELDDAAQDKIRWELTRIPKRGRLI
jgi:hypothetical protein